MVQNNGFPLHGNDKRGNGNDKEKRAGITLVGEVTYCD
jgi:hypothetical protein